MSDLTVASVLGENGVFSRRLPGYRERPGQVAMAEAVAASIQNSRHLVVEAPTGVGKSFAYLTPALLSAVGAGRRVVVATHTIALQDQLLTKDLPFLDACLPVEFVAVKALGRSNYLSLRRLDVALMGAPLLMSQDDEVRGLRRLQQWVKGTTEGVRQELDPSPGALWEDVQSEGDNCLGRRCPTHDECFFQSARKRLFNADVIVTNHALYFTDLMLRQRDMALLPDHDVLILDEAHHVESVAANCFGITVSKRYLLHFLSRLASPGRDVGVLSHATFSGLKDDAVAKVKDLRLRVNGFFDEVEAWRQEAGPKNGRVRHPGIADDVLSRAFNDLAGLLTVMAQDCPEEKQAVEILAAGRRAGGFAEEIAAFLEVGDSDSVYYVNENGRGRDVRLEARPLDVAKTLGPHLFDRVSSVIMTSATLSTGRSARGLEFAAERLGCPGAETLILDAPFSYEDHVEVHVPPGIPHPGEDGHEQAAAAAIEHYVRYTGGGAFILGTSYQSLNALHRRLVAPLERAGFLVLRQGDGADRGKLLHDFRENGNAVLFGADSFWEGVDVPGPALRLVILCRLPFPVPSTPFNEALSERLRTAGKEPFSAFSLPTALLKFRQGFGRLIRAEDDEGLVVCLDRRIVDKGYGRAFREATPPCPWRFGPLPTRDTSLDL